MHYFKKQISKTLIGSKMKRWFLAEISKAMPLLGHWPLREWLALTVLVSHQKGQDESGMTPGEGPGARPSTRISWADKSLNGVCSRRGHPGLEPEGISYDHWKAQTHRKWVLPYPPKGPFHRATSLSPVWLNLSPSSLRVHFLPASSIF